MPGRGAARGARALKGSAAALALTLLAGLSAAGCGGTASAAPARTDAYLYEDTRRLVGFVEAAATLVEQRGAGAFAELGRPGSRWRTSPTYLFVYDRGGTCVVHGLNPGLVGRNLLALRDALGKPVVAEIVDLARQPERDASRWIFYLWEEQTELQPSWKASYVRKAQGPDGTVYLVGSGSSSLKVEKVFVQGEVDAAAELLRQQGPAATFRELQAPGSRFYFLGSFVYVLDARGHSVVDPAYPTIEGRDMSGFRDAVGRPVVREVLQKLAKHDSAWVQYLWHKPGEMLPSRKLMYVRKVEVDGAALLVGSDFYLATPIWMKL